MEKRVNNYSWVTKVRKGCQKVFYFKNPLECSETRWTRRRWMDDHNERVGETSGLFFY